MFGSKRRDLSSLKLIAATLQSLGHGERLALLVAPPDRAGVQYVCARRPTRAPSGWQAGAKLRLKGSRAQLIASNIFDAHCWLGSAQSCTRAAGGRITKGRPADRLCVRPSLGKLGVCVQAPFCPANFCALVRASFSFSLSLSASASRRLALALASCEPIKRHFIVRPVLPTTHTGDLVLRRHKAAAPSCSRPDAPLI